MASAEAGRLSGAPLVAGEHLFVTYARSPHTNTWSFQLTTNNVDIATGPSSAGFRQQFAQRVERAGASGVQISVCGPQGLLDQVRQLMRETGVAEDRLQHELFEFR